MADGAVVLQRRQSCDSGAGFGANFPEGVDDLQADGAVIFEQLDKLGYRLGGGRSKPA